MWTYLYTTTIGELFLAYSPDQNAMFANAVIESPKQTNADRLGRATWYPYYAGFPSRFSHSLLQSLDIDKGMCVVDPWNGSGTTTEAAQLLGISSLGIDLNPAMVVVAKGRSICSRQFPSLVPIAKDILKKSRNLPAGIFLDNNLDPLTAWFAPSSIQSMRGIEFSIRKLLVSEKSLLASNADQKIFDSLSDIACFFYVALFRTARKLLRQFYASNPTWLKAAKSPRHRIRPSKVKIERIFFTEVEKMISQASFEEVTLKNDTPVSIKEGCSTKLPIPDASVDAILTSPPYCTRIDYAVATMVELVLLGFDPKTNLDNLRRRLLGTSTVPKTNIHQSNNWGDCCNLFLKRVQKHSSKASQNYYYKNHLQYFDGAFKSLAEVSRVLRPGAGAAFVVQDSYYKEVHNNLPQTFIEMASHYGMTLSCRKDFRQKRSMAGLNPNVRRYRKSCDTTESVLCFSKN